MQLATNDAAMRGNGKFMFSKFVLAGITATATTYAVLIVGVEVLSVSATGASVAGYALGIVVNYLLNYRFTFSATKRHGHTFPKFIAVMLVGMIANACIMLVCINVIGIHYLIAQLIAISIVLMWSFAANRYWTFAD